MVYYLNRRFVSVRPQTSHSTEMLPKLLYLILPKRLFSIMKVHWSFSSALVCTSENILAKSTYYLLLYQCCKWTCETSIYLFIISCGNKLHVSPEFPISDWIANLCAFMYGEVKSRSEVGGLHCSGYTFWNTDGSDTNVIQLRKTPAFCRCITHG